MQTENAEAQKHVRAYLTVFAALLMLTLITVGVSYVEASIAVAVVIALAIATLKGSLVAAVFMHLAAERLWVVLFVVAVAASAALLVVFMALSFHDPITGTELSIGARPVPAETVH